MKILEINKFKGMVKTEEGWKYFREIGIKSLKEAKRIMRDNKDK